MIDEKMLDLGVAGILALVALKLLQIIGELIKSRNGNAPPNRDDLKVLTAEVAKLGDAFRTYTHNIELNYNKDDFKENTRRVEEIHRTVTKDHAQRLESIDETTGFIHEMLLGRGR